MYFNVRSYTAVSSLVYVLVPNDAEMLSPLQSESSGINFKEAEISHGISVLMRTR